MRKEYIIGLDIGSINIHTVVTGYNPERNRLEVFASLVTPSRGIRRGVVVDLEEARTAIAEVARTLQESIGDAISNVFVSIGGSHVSIKSSKGVVAVSRADGEVSEEDVARVISAAKTFSLPQNREILHTIPRQFTVDNEEGIENPVGMTGVRLEVDALIIEAFSPFVRNIEKTLTHNNIQAASYVFGPLAASEAILSKRQKELGVLLLDIGGATTSLAVFEEASLLHATALPVGSMHITNDLAIGFKIPIEAAERIKMKYGVIGRNNEDLQEQIDVNTLELPDKNITITRGKVNDIIEARVAEILELINRELKSIDRERLLPAGVVLVGGGAKLQGIAEFAKNSLGLPSQIGYPLDIGGLIEEVNDPIFATGVGLTKYALSVMDRQHHPSPLFQMTGWGARLKEWLKNLLP